jgi:hypothetical protein
MVYVESWYNADLLAPEQIAMLQGQLERDLAAFAEDEPEAGDAEADEADGYGTVERGDGAAPSGPEPGGGTDAEADEPEAG